MKSMTRQERREKAERTHDAASEIIAQERAASEAKTARLRALRAEREGGEPGGDGAKLLLGR